MFTGTRGEGRGVGEGSEHVMIKEGGGAVSKKIFVGPSGPQFGLKITDNNNDNNN